MIRDFEDFCRELQSCGFSMGGGNAKGIFALIDFDWTVPPREDNPVRWHTGDPETDPWEWRMRVLEERGFEMPELEPGESYERIKEQILRLNPAAEERTLRKFILG